MPLRVPLIVALFCLAVGIGPAQPADKPGTAEKPGAAAKPGAAGKPSPGNSSLIGGLPNRRQGHPDVFLAWHAPWGTPGARDTATFACSDTLGADTLYLTFDPGEDIEKFTGIDLTLLFHAATGDTLGPFWDLSRKGVNPYNLRIEFDPPPEGAPSLWPVIGTGQTRYTWGGTTARLDLTYYVAASKGGSVFAGIRYFGARVMIRVRKPQLSGCLQPVCVELDHVWASQIENSRWINTGQRFVSLNSPGGRVCHDWRLIPPSEEPPRFGGANRDEIPAARDTTRH